MIIARIRLLGCSDLEDKKRRKCKRATTRNCRLAPRTKSVEYRIAAHWRALVGLLVRSPSTSSSGIDLTHRLIGTVWLEQVRRALPTKAASRGSER